MTRDPETTPGEKPKRRRQPVRKGATRSQSPTSPEAIARRARDLKCVQLRSANVGWQVIADQLGYASPGHAYDSFMLVMKEFPREDVDTWRNMISDRHEQALRALWPDVLRGKWLAIDRTTRILEALAKLHGANRPDKIEVSSGETDLDAALRELEEQMRRRAARDNTPVPKE
jgi:hypothetical protein